MKIVTVVGARPQFVKCAAVSRKLRQSATEVLVHTGQHYDDRMSDVFFRQLQIPRPDHELNVGSGAHGEQTATMLRGCEEVLQQERPHYCLVYGDTNSTLAGALAAVKLHIPVAHVEAGLRSFNRRMPEEINRVLTDHASDLLLCPTNTSVENLSREGITRGVKLVGDVMYDALLFYLDAAEQQSTMLETLRLCSKKYVLATVHRAENTVNRENLRSIVNAFSALASSGCPVVFPIHPRTRKALSQLNRPFSGAIRLIDPVSYLDMLMLLKHAELVLTDSGGLQKEACWTGTPCVTLREETEWVETVEAGWNQIAGADTAKILAACSSARPGREVTEYGRGNAGDQIITAIADSLRD